jgi:hypothetical protein
MFGKYQEKYCKSKKKKTLKEGKHLGFLCFVAVLDI